MRSHAQEHPEAVKHLAPSVFRQFACAAGTCPDSCCRAGWEIVIDPETLAGYEKLPGPEGERIRQAVRSGEEPLLRQDENRVCVLLDPDGLCCAQKRFGHESLCRVCREYPRFHREFGNLTEHGISLSCPTAFALATAAPPAWEQWEDEAPIVPNDLDPERYLPLREGRDLALKLLGDESRSLRERLILVYVLSERLQQGLDGQRRTGKLACKRLSSSIGQKAALRRYGSLRPYRGADVLGPWRGRRLDRWLGVFAGLEILSSEWKDALQTLRRDPGQEASGRRRPPRSEASGEDAARRQEVYARYLWYSLYKYWLDAADDGRLLPRVRRSFAMTLLGQTMDRYVPKERSWLQRISREIEHCEENLEALLEK